MSNTLIDELAAAAKTHKRSGHPATAALLVRAAEALTGTPEVRAQLAQAWRDVRAWTKQAQDNEHKYQLLKARLDSLNSVLARQLDSTQEPLICTQNREHGRMIPRLYPSGTVVRCPVCKSTQEIERFATTCSKEGVAE